MAKNKYLDLIKKQILFNKKNKKNSILLKKQNSRNTIWWEKHGNTSSWANIMVSVIVAVFTLLLFRQAQKQNKISEENIQIAQLSAHVSEISADAAIKSVNISDSLFKLTKESNKSNDSNFILQLKVTQSAAAAANILAINGQKSLEFSRKNFATLNQPYILISNCVSLFDSLNPHKNIEIGLIFFNYGNSPALATRIRNGFTFSDQLALDTFRYIEPKSELNNYIKSNGQFNNITKIDVEKMAVQIELFRKGIIFIYSFGELTYKDIITNKSYKYKYCIKFFPDGRYNFNKFNNELVSE